MNTGVRSGLDVVEVERLRSALERHPGLRERVFTPAESAYCESKADPVVSLAARFAAKEAVGKLLGSGVLTWLEIEVTPERGVRLSGRTAALAASLGVAQIALSLTHTGSLAAASAVALARTGVDDADPEDAGAESIPHVDGAVAPVLLKHAPLEARPLGFTSDQIRELDRVAIEEMGVPGAALMERAALGVSELVLRRYPRLHTLVVCGRGNNGGDGLAAARQMHLAGHPVACVVVGPEAELGADCALQLESARKAGVNVRVGGVPDYLWEETELVVDCLLGTGARAELREPVAGWAAKINAAAHRGTPVVAVDVPTGVDASTGKVAAGAVAADCTVTFHAAKSGIVTPPGSEAAGEVLVWDIGLPRFREPAPDVRVVTAADVEVPGRRPDDHKYRAGLVVVLAGSRDYPGAALLAASAAARCGAGYVRLLTARAAADVVRERLVEVVVRGVGAGDHVDDPKAVLEALADERTGSLVVGPGLGRHPGTMEVVRRVVTEDGCPMVLDADGILAFAGDAESLAVGRDLVLTPHAGELAALLGEPVDRVTRSALSAARRAATLTGQVVVLKGSSTVVVGTDGTSWVVTQGPPQLASAGTGDVLSGCIGALLAVGMRPLEASCAAAWLHAEAGRRGALVYKAGLLAQDLIEILPVVLAERVFDRRPGWTR